VSKIVNKSLRDALVFLLISLFSVSFERSKLLHKVCLHTCSRQIPPVQPVKAATKEINEEVQDRSLGTSYFRALRV
jgi:hypothetical protein